MKTFPSNFITEKNKKAGAKPVWILKCPFPNTGTIYLSDQEFSVASWNGGITTKAWIKRWGNIDENISGYEMSAARVSDFGISVIIDPGSSPNIETILWTAANNIETTDCELYLWFVGLNAATDPPQRIWAGNIVDFVLQDELTCDIEMVDQSVRIDKYVGTEITTSVYPNADLDDVGKVGNVGYGVVKKVPARAVIAGALDYLNAAMTASQTTLDLVDTSRFPSSGTVGIDAEDITYTGKTATQLTGLTRGANSTTPAVHNRGSHVWEQRSDFTYEAFSHPIKQFDNIFAAGLSVKLRITGSVTTYTGKTGSQHPTWPNRAMVVVPAKITKEEAVNILVSDGITVDDAISIVDTIAVDDTIAINDLIAVADNIAVSQGSHGHTSPDRIITVRVEDWINNSGSWAWQSGYSFRYDGDFTTGDYISSSTANTNFYRRTSAAQAGTPVRMRQCVTSGDPGMYQGTGTAKLWVNGTHMNTISIGGSSKQTVKSSWYNFTNWNDLIASNTCIQVEGNYQLFVYEIWYEVDLNPSPPAGPAVGVAKSGSAYRTGDVTKSGSVSKSGTVSRSGSVSKSGTVTMSGNSVTDTVIADKLVVDAQGYQDDASGTITGTPNLLIERPDHVMKHFVAIYSNWPVANFYTNAGSQFASKNYKFSVIINEKRRLKEWLTLFAFQCRCYYRIANNQAQLLWRPDSPSSVKTINNNMIRMREDYKTTTRVRRSPLEQVINKISLHYDRDWTKQGITAYKAVTTAEDATSITRYGEKEKPHLFDFDFVTTSGMANDLRDFYLNFYKNRKKLVAMDLFLDNSELEFADAITVTPLGSLVGETQKVNFLPGSGIEMRNDRLEIIVREY